MYYIYVHTKVIPPPTENTPVRGSCDSNKWIQNKVPGFLGQYDKGRDYQTEIPSSLVTLTHPPQYSTRTRRFSHQKTSKQNYCFWMFITHSYGTMMRISHQKTWYIPMLKGFSTPKSIVFGTSSMAKTARVT